MNITIWHNNVCSTSRKALDFLESKEVEIKIRNYIQDAPSIEEIEEVLLKLNRPATTILRKKDKVFQEKFINKNLSEKEWIKAMSENPSIIERPIVISENKAWLARPLEEWISNFDNQ